MKAVASCDSGKQEKDCEIGPKRETAKVNTVTVEDREKEIAMVASLAIAALEKQKEPEEMSAPGSSVRPSMQKARKLTASDLASSRSADKLNVTHNTFERCVTNDQRRENASIQKKASKYMPQQASQAVHQQVLSITLVQPF